MHIKALQIKNLRALAHIDLEPGPGINVIHGPNGAGKTSILEAVYLAGRGRSFRHSDARPVIKAGAEEALVVLKLADTGRLGEHRLSTLGVARTAKDMRCRFNGVDVHKRSQLAEALPVQWIGSQPQTLLELGPDVRRRFLDMAVFHVEHAYLDHLSIYQRALRQRNAAIRSGSAHTVSAWDETLATTGETVDRHRREVLRGLMPHVDQLINAWGLGFDVDWRYRRGWAADRPLLSALSERTSDDLERGFTSFGPHRAELVLTVSGANKGGTKPVPAEKSLSRGQLKMFVVALNLALIDLTKTADESVLRPVLLIDDLAAELDYANREKVIDGIAARGCQAFVTRLTDDRLPERPEIKVFHVEHGQLVA